MASEDGLMLNTGVMQRGGKLEGGELILQGWRGRPCGPGRLAACPLQNVHMRDTKGLLPESSLDDFRPKPRDAAPLVGANGDGADRS